MIYLFKCRICEFRFAYAEEGEVLCPRCGAKYIRKTSKKNVKIAKRSKYTGDFVKVGGKRCRTCLYFSEETTTSATTKCTFSKPEVNFNKTSGWVCHSFKAGNVCKKMKR